MKCKNAPIDILILGGRPRKGAWIEIFKTGQKLLLHQSPPQGGVD